MIAWLVDAAAIVAQQALRDSSYAPYARTMRKICWEESVHIMHGRDVVVTMVTGSPAQRAAIQDALDRWWGPLMQMHGPRSPREKDRDLHWRIKAKTSEELRQEFLTIYVPRIRELGLVIPDPDLRFDDGDRAVAVRRAGLGRAAHGRHQPRTDVAVAPRVPAARPRGDALGPRGDPRASRRPHEPTDASARPRPRSPPPRRRSSRPGRSSAARRTATRCATAGASWRPTRELATHYARELYGRRQESVRLWVVRRADILDLDDPDLLQPPLDRSFKKPGGYVMRDKLAAAREAVRPGQAEGTIVVSAASARPADHGPGRASCARWPTTSSSSASPIPSGRASPRCSRRTSR